LYGIALYIVFSHPNKCLTLLRDKINVIIFDPIYWASPFILYAIYIPFIIYPKFWFVCHINLLFQTSFLIQIFLRISPELYLKRLLVAGFPKVFELNRNFRNEGVDVTHSPEFTMLEFYSAYETAKDQRDFVERLLKSVVKKVFKKDTLEFKDQKINFKNKFAVTTYFDLFSTYADIKDVGDMNIEEISAKAREMSIPVERGDGIPKIMDNIYKKYCRPKLIQPTFIIDYPADMLPLAKRKSDNPELVDAFQLVIGGTEMVKAFSELNDPLDQRERFEAQEKNKKMGDGEAQRLDEDFLEAMEYGMPPAAGVGIGIDRLVMLLTNTHNIRDVILFPP
jgi:lysyl-tRNA synthetase class 2